MPVRFRRTIQIFPGVKMNVSKGGVSFTVGTKGYHLNFSNRGVKQTVGVPGTGVSHSTYLLDHDSDADEKTEGKKKASTRRKRTSKDESADDIELESRQQAIQERAVARRTTPAWVLFIALVVIYLGALVLGLIPANFLSQVLNTLLDWTRSMGL